MRIIAREKNTQQLGVACVHTAVLAGHYHGIHSVSNAFITDIFTPFSVLISLRLGASRAVNPLPTHTDDSKRALGLRNALALENGPPRSNALPGTVTTVFPKRGSERKVGAILCARIDCDHSPRTRDAIRETPACSWHALQLSPRRGQAPLVFKQGRERETSILRFSAMFASLALSYSESSSAGELIYNDAMSARVRPAPQVRAPASRSRCNAYQDSYW